MMRHVSRFVIFATLPALLGQAGCRKAVPPPVTEVRAISSTAIPADPADVAWRNAPEYVAKLLLQDIVEPRLVKLSTELVRVRAIRNGSEVAFRLEWADATENSLPGAARFSDACAIQVPAKIEPTVPAPQMGERNRPVEITYWCAAWQATVDGRGDSIKDIYPNASVDHYPFEAKSLEKGSPAQREMALRYAPARALGNTMAGPRHSPVQDLIAEGPGTIIPATTPGSNGRGTREADGWAVVIVRRLPTGLSPAAPSQIAFAVWDGAGEEIGSRKMRTAWIPLVFEEKP
jgi:hypothetical protein